MNDLSAEDKAFLDLARDADDPSPAQRERMSLRIAAKLGIAVGTISASASTSAAASTIAASVGGSTVLTSSGTVAVKIAAIIAVMSASAGGAALYRSSRGPAPVAAAATAKAAPAPAPPTHAPPIAIVSFSETEPASVASTPSAIPSAPPTAPPSRTHATRSPLVTEKEISMASLEDETRLVQTGVAALRVGDAASALARFDEHARKYPQGVLAEERAAERVLALCALGRETEARAAADRFLVEHPSAPVAGKVRASCASAMRARTDVP